VQEMDDVMEAAGIGQEEAEVQEAIRRSVMDATGLPQLPAHRFGLGIVIVLQSLSCTEG
jgi:hypothetical protein